MGDGGGFRYGSGFGGKRRWELSDLLCIGIVKFSILNWDSNFCI
jgi:hypothetical protein